MALIFICVAFTTYLHHTILAENPQTSTPLSSYEVIASWSQIDFEFPSTEEREKMLNSSEFIPANNIITHLKVAGKRIFLTIPRRKPGIPVTLAYMSYNPSSITLSNPTKQQTNSPKLIPYPNWEAQLVGDCKSFQYVQSLETDTFNRIWILDTGLRHRNDRIPFCPPKLVIVDLETDKQILVYEFPSQVVQNLLGDMVVACPNSEDPQECWAYLSDPTDGRIIIFNLRNKHSWAVRHSSMKANGSASNITILGHNYSFLTGISGVAISPLDIRFEKLYYCPLSSYNLFSVSTNLLQMAGSSGYSHKLQDSEIELVGQRFSQSDSLAMASNGLLFYGVLSSNAVTFWNTSSKNVDPNNEVLLVQNDIDLQWPGSFSFDNNGYLYATTNRMQMALAESYDPNDINFRIIRVFIGSKSYQHSAKETLATLRNTGPGSINNPNLIFPNPANDDTSSVNSASDDVPSTFYTLSTFLIPLLLQLCLN